MDAASVPGGKAQLLGKNPFDIEQFAGPLRHYLGAGSRAVSSLKIALWDFIGKAAQQPLYKLWGAAKERVPAYASAGQSDGAEEPAASSKDNATSMSAIEAIWGPSTHSDSTWKRRTSK
jgi:L-alanine-DL-glutamate epimerase-like enolase superfamily enzyme